MAPRLSRRQLREKDELLNLSGSLGQDPEDEQHLNSIQDENSTEQTATKERAVGFAALVHLDEGLNEDSSEEIAEEDEASIPKAPKKKNKKKKKKKQTEDSDALKGENIHNNTTPSQNKSGKKAKGKEKPQVEGDDLDRALAELSEKYPDLKDLSLSTNKKADLFTQPLLERQNNLLSVSLPQLDSESEMRRFFGAKIVNVSKSQTKQPRMARANMHNLKSNLTKPQPTWWSASQRENLSIRTLTSEERSNLPFEDKKEKWWTIEYSKSYRNVTKGFMDAVLSGDPNRLFMILSKLPWHADTLLQMAEYYRHREEHASSVDFLNRALFTYERGLIGAFSFTIGTNRLDFNRVENRPFYLALSRTIMDLNRRGCTRSSFEFAKLLLGLNPYSDPHGSLLFLDYLSIRAGMHKWLLSLWEIHSKEAEIENGITHKRFNVTTLPGWSYARALALRAEESSTKESGARSTEALIEAILKFPSVVPLLADKIDINLPSSLRGLPIFQIHVDSSNLSSHESLIHLLSQLYAHRSASLWKLPENSSWFKTTILSLYENSQFASIKPMQNQISDQYGLVDGSVKSLVQSELARSIYRHVAILSDANLIRQLNAFFPREILNMPSLSCDPLPPLSRVSEYNDSFFSSCEDIFAFRPRTRREREFDARQLARMIPDANVRHQIQALYDARPDIQQQFPGGVLQFAQIVAQLGEDFMDNFIPQFGEGIGGDQLPGGFPGDIDVRDDGLLEQADVEAEEHIDEDDLEEEEATADVPVFPVRMWQNLVNRLWGGERGGNDNTDNDQN